MEKIKSYRELKEKENRAKLFGVIKGKVDFLSDEEIKKVVEKIDTNKKYKIIVVKEDFDELVGYLVYTQYNGFRHSWAGEQYFRTEQLNILIGEDAVKKIGNSNYYQYFNNGNIENEVDEFEDPEFDVDRNIVVEIITIHYSDYNNNYYNYQENLLVFYKGVRI